MVPTVLIPRGGGGALLQGGSVNKSSVCANLIKTIIISSVFANLIKTIIICYYQYFKIVINARK